MSCPLRPWVVHACSALSVVWIIWLAAVWARPPPSSGECSSCCMPNYTVSPARHGHTGSRWFRRPDSSRPREGITVRDLRRATCDFESRAAGAGCCRLRFADRTEAASGYRDPRGPNHKEGTSAAGSVWLGSGLGHASVYSAGSTGSSGGPLPLPGSPSPTGMRSAGINPVPSQSKQRLANHIVDVGHRACTDQRARRRSRAHKSRE